MFASKIFYMRQALMLANRYKFNVSPNPMVGCVIVKNGEIIGEGAHEYFGGNHAEVNAIQSVKKDSIDNSTIYITLEPCCYHNKTPSCLDIIIKSNFSKVIIATLDPNPKVSGKSVKALYNHDIDVEVGLLKDEAIKLNKIFFYYHSKKIPYVFMKWAISMDGHTKSCIKDSKQMSCIKSQQHTHNLRSLCDAIIIGRKTLVEDNPILDTRFSSIKKVKHPIRIVISQSGNIKIDANIFNTAKIIPTILFTSAKIEIEKRKKLEEKGVECIILETNHSDRLSMKKILTLLAQRGITSILVEGGMRLHQSFLKEDLVNEIYSYVVPQINAFKQRKQVKKIRHLRLDHDVLLRGNIREE